MENKANVYHNVNKQYLRKVSKTREQVNHHRIVNLKCSISSYQISSIFCVFFFSPPSINFFLLCCNNSLPLSFTYIEMEVYISPREFVSLSFSLYDEHWQGAFRKINFVVWSTNLRKSIFPRKEKQRAREMKSKFFQFFFSTYFTSLDVVVVDVLKYSSLAIYLFYIHIYVWRLLCLKLFSSSPIPSFSLCLHHRCYQRDIIIARVIGHRHMHS